MTLEPPNFRELEVKLVASKGKDRSLIDKIYNEVNEYKHKLDYITTKFIDDYGNRIETETKRNAVYHKFIKVKSEQYAEATRMIRVLDYYSTL